MKLPFYIKWQYVKRQLIMQFEIKCNSRLFYDKEMYTCVVCGWVTDAGLDYVITCSISDEDNSNLLSDLPSQLI